MRYFKLPDLGEGLQEAEIVEWHVQPGAEVSTDQLLVSVETAKAIVDIPSPQTGTIARCFGKPGELLHTGAPLVEFANTASDDTGTVVGELRSADDSHNNNGDDKSTRDNRSDQFFIGAGPATRQWQLQQHEAKPQATSPLSRNIGDSEPLRGTRRVMANIMSAAQREVAAVTLCEDADIEHWPAKTDVTIRLCLAIAHAAQSEPGLNAWFDGQQLARRLLSHIDIGIAVDTADGLFVPVLRNVGERTESDLRQGLNRLRDDVLKRTIPAAEMQGATITLSNFGTLNSKSTNADCNSTAQPASKIMGGRYASPIIVPPMVAIIGAGTIRREVVAINGGSGGSNDKSHDIAIHRRLPLSLTFDHRCITGGEAARFLGALISHLQG